jgi:4-amino-4-deoxy-L-arabinose transferase-like glycosyltransferase
MQTTSTTRPSAEPRPAPSPAARDLALPRVSGTALALAALVLIGLALRLWFIAVNDIDPRFSASDDGDYYQRAVRLAATGEYLDNSWLIRPPGHVFMFAAMIRLAIALGDPTLGIAFIRGFQVLLSLLLILAGYDMARRLFGRPAGLIFAAVLAVWFPLVELPALILSEPLFLSTLLLHCWLLLRWRDSKARPGWRPYAWLVAAGVSLAICALARSPALYASVFVAGFLAVETWRGRALGAWLRRFAPAGLAFILPFALLIAPWTIRNYLTYGELIPIDTTGPVNLWLALQPERIDGGKSVLAGIPQQERQAFVSGEIRRIISEDPLWATRAFVPHFIHIWKAQFVEDFFVKVSFFTRPLREIWPIGALGDLIWLVFTPASLFALAGRPREGGVRLIALGWIAYSCLTVMLIHVEPRYLLPIWLFMGLYGAGALGRLYEWLRLRRESRPAAARQARAYLRSPWGFGGLALCLALLALIFWYRDYPRIIAGGLAREQERAAAAAAHARGDYPAAIAAYERMLAVAPGFVDGRTELARVYLELGRYDEAWAALGERPTHRADVIRGALARAQGDAAGAVAYFSDAEVRAGEDVQRLTLEWLRPAPIMALSLGDGLDFGYVQGFSFGERLAAPGGEPFTYRWLAGHGRVVLPLTRPLRAGDSVRLRLTGGLPGDTPLRLTLGGSPTTIAVRGGQWRDYQVTVPASLAGQTTLDLRLDAPAFIPAQTTPGSDDARLLSLMVSHVSVE